MLRVLVPALGSGLVLVPNALGQPSTTPPAAVETLGPAASTVPSAVPPGVPAADSSLYAPEQFILPAKKPAWAQQKQGITLLQQAKKLQDAGDCPKAVPLLADAYRTGGDPLALRRTVDCAKAEGQWVHAYVLTQLLQQNHPAVTPTERDAQAKELQEVASKTATLVLEARDADASLTLDGQPTVPGTVRLLPGKHSVKAAKAGQVPFEQELELAAGSEQRVSVELKAVERKAPSTENKNQVLDFCQLPPPDPKASAYQTQRLVLFDLGGEEVTNQPEKEVNKKGDVIGEHSVFASVGMHNHVRNSFLGSFPMERFHNVGARVVAPAGLSEQETVSDAEMIRAAEHDPFAAYSLACADWVGIPRITRKDAQWQQVEQKKTVIQNGKSVEVVEYTWALTVVWGLELAVFEHTSEGWIRRAKVEGANEGAFDAALELAGIAPAGDGSDGKPPILSRPPEPTCNVPLASSVAKLADSFLTCGEAAQVASSVASDAFSDQLSADKAEEKAKAEAKAKADAEAQAKADAEAKAKADAAAQAGAETKPSGAATDEKNAASGAGPGAKDSAASAAGDKAGEGKTPDDSAAVASDGTKPAGDTSEADAKPDAAKSGADASEPKPERSEAEKVAERTREQEESALAKISRGTLEAVAEGDPTASLGRLAAMEAKENAPPSVLEAVGAAKEAVEACQGGVNATVQLSKELRSLASNPTKALAESALGFAACLGVPLTFDLAEATPPGTAQRKSKFCTNVHPDVSRGFPAMQEVAVCEGRIGAEHATLIVQRDAKRLDGWRLFAGLQPPPAGKVGGYGIAMGKHEGAARGHVYTAEGLGFGHIIEVGPGGDEGAENPSYFKFRKGDAPLGTRLEEWAQVGVLLGGRPQVGMLLSKGDLASSLVFGAAIQGGYNAGSFVPVGDDFWARVDLGYAVGEQGESFLSLELLPEAQFYAFDGAAWYLTSGFGYALAMKKLSTAESGNVEPVTISGANYSVIVGAGLDYAFSPEWNLRFGAQYRQGVSTAKLVNAKETVVELDGGNLSQLQGDAALMYTY